MCQQVDFPAYLVCLGFAFPQKSLRVFFLAIRVYGARPTASHQTPPRLLGSQVYNVFLRWFRAVVRLSTESCEDILLRDPGNRHLLQYPAACASSGPRDGHRAPPPKLGTTPFL